MEYKLNLRKILSRRFRYFFKFHIQNIVIWGRKILAECRIFACGGEGDQCLSFPPAPSLNLRPCTQWRSRKFVKGRGGAPKARKIFWDFFTFDPPKNSNFSSNLGHFEPKLLYFRPFFMKIWYNLLVFSYFRTQRKGLSRIRPPPATPLPVPSQQRG